MHIRKLQQYEHNGKATIFYNFCNFHLVFKGTLHNQQLEFKVDIVWETNLRLQNLWQIPEQRRKKERKVVNFLITKFENASVIIWLMGTCYRPSHIQVPIIHYFRWVLLPISIIMTPMHEEYEVTVTASNWRGGGRKFVWEQKCTENEQRAQQISFVSAWWNTGNKIQTL